MTSAVVFAYSEVGARCLEALYDAGVEVSLVCTHEDDPNEPYYDPVQLGGAVLVTLTAIGCLYWLLWTLLVYEGGLPTKLRAGLAVLSTSRTLKDFGYAGTPYAMGAFEGWVGNVAALVLTLLVVAALYNLYHLLNHANLFGGGYAAQAQKVSEELLARP